jgi:hypothetical protein
MAVNNGLERMWEEELVPASYSETPASYYYVLERGCIRVLD